MRVFVVDYAKANKNREAVYKLVVERKEGNNYIYEDIIKSAKQLAKAPEVCRAFVNARLDGDELVGTTGTLDRFINGNIKPLVVISEVVNETGLTVGYKVSTVKGKIIKVVRGELIKHCKKVVEQGEIPLQNAMYVSDKGGYIRNYPGAEFNKEVVRTKKNVHAVPAEPEKSQNVETVSNKSKLLEIFTKEQLIELSKANKAKVNVKIIGNPKLSPEQMRLIWRAEADGYKARVYSNPEYSVEVMQYLDAELYSGVSDISQLLNPKYTVEQLFELTLGLETGVDISKYSNPNIPAKEMANMREQLLIETWDNFKVVSGDLLKGFYI